MVTELIIGKMGVNIRVINMREIGKMIPGMEKELTIGKMGMNIRDIFMIIKLTVTEFIFGKMGVNIRDIG